jgi:hypothetical protein
LIEVFQGNQRATRDTAPAIVGVMTTGFDRKALSGVADDLDHGRDLLHRLRKDDARWQKSGT